jgi:quercetin dioxygenase-like cupin family protein
MTLIERFAYVLALICYAPLPPDTLAAQVPPSAIQAAPSAKHESTRSVLTQSVPIHGNNLTVQMVEVHYGPGESSQPHSHPCPVIAYVVTGAVRTQVHEPGKPDPGPIVVYRAGETFYESPNGVHLVSSNASQSEPATLLATFLCDRPTSAVTTPVPSAKGAALP